MSSDQYGFTCDIIWGRRTYSIQVVFLGTDESDPEGTGHIINGWGSIRPEDLAEYELNNRDWKDPYSYYTRISVWQCVGGWLQEDTTNPLWSPPQPTEREIMELLARGDYKSLNYGWDT